MESARKLLLVDPARASQLYKPSITDIKRGVLDSNISHVLSSDLPDDEKAKRYLMAIKTYRNIDSHETVKPDPETDIVKSIPFEFRTKAKRLLKHVKPHLKWSDDGEIVSKGSVLPYSDIAELLADSVAVRPSAKRPIGWEEFADTLKTAGIPHELISNTRLLKHMLPPPPRKKKATEAEKLTSDWVSKPRLSKPVKRRKSDTDWEPTPSTSKTVKPEKFDSDWDID